MPLMHLSLFHFQIKHSYIMHICNLTGILLGLECVSMAQVVCRQWLQRAVTHGSAVAGFAPAPGWLPGCSCPLARDQNRQTDCRCMRCYTHIALFALVLTVPCKPFPGVDHYRVTLASCMHAWVPCAVPAAVSCMDNMNRFSPS